MSMSIRNPACQQINEMICAKREERMIEERPRSEFCSRVNLAGSELLQHKRKTKREENRAAVFDTQILRENLALVHLPSPDNSLELQQAVLPTGRKFGRRTPRGAEKKKSAAEFRA